MVLPFIPSDAGLLALQAAVVAAPRQPHGLDRLTRLTGRGWALVPIGSILVVVFAIRFVSDTATALTYLALVAVPPLAALALGWAIRGARPPAALAVVPLFAIAWVLHKTLAGEAAGALLSALSCVTLAVLLGAVTPANWLKAGILLMAAADTWLVVSDLLHAPNATLISAHPAAGLPRLQTEIFGSVSMGYGDLFIAAVLGAVIAADRRRQRSGALLTLAFAAVFDLLFLVVGELPATVPVALALIALEVWDRRQVRHHATPGPEPRGPEPPGLPLSAGRRPSTPAGATPRRAT